METLASAFTRLNLTDRIVVDRTGLAGEFGLEVVWAAQATDEGASLFTAMQEQLGLKLEPRTEPLEALVIEHIEPPEPN